MTLLGHYFLFVLISFVSLNRNLSTWLFKQDSTSKTLNALKKKSPKKLTDQFRAKKGAEIYFFFFLKLCLSSEQSHL